jgi:hypothetical protein
MYIFKWNGLFEVFKHISQDEKVTLRYVLKIFAKKLVKNISYMTIVGVILT